MESESNRLKIKDLYEYTFSPANVSLTQRSGKVIRVVKPGGFVDSNYLKKFEKVSNRLEILSMSNFSIVNNLESLFKRYAESKDEIERIRVRRSLLMFFSGLIWHGDKIGSLLDLVLVGDRHFLKFDFDAKNKLREFGEDFLIRSSLMAILGVFMAIAMGYLNYKFLCDLYHFFYLIDYGLKGELNYNITIALQKERLKSGDGLKFLGVKKLKRELENLKTHVVIDRKKIISEFGQFFNDSSILRMIAVHHERIDGSGFPSSLSEHDLSDIESLIIFVNHLVPVKEFNFERKDGVSYLKRKFDNLNSENDVLSIRIRKLLLEMLSQQQTWDEFVGDVKEAI